MRPLILFAALAVFTAISFVPPGDTVVAVADTPNTNTIIRIDGAEMAQAVSGIAHNVAEQSVAATKKDIVFDENAESSTIMQNVSDAIDKLNRGWREVREQDPDGTIKGHFMYIEWAREKNKASACEDLEPLIVDEREVDGQFLQTPSRGDWLAYCLARVTDNKKRCNQIEEGKDPDLKTLCKEELQ